MHRPWAATTHMYGGHVYCICALHAQACSVVSRYPHILVVRNDHFDAGIAPVDCVDDEVHMITKLGHDLRIK